MSQQISMDDFEGYMSTTILASCSKSYKSLDLICIPIQDFTAYRVYKSNKLLREYSTLRPAIAFYNTL
jgi:hypothetical protein